MSTWLRFSEQSRCTPAALRYLQRLSRPDQERVQATLVRLAEGLAVYPGVVHMAGEWKGYQRIRIGNLRVIFWYDEQADIIYGHSKKIMSQH